MKVCEGCGASYEPGQEVDPCLKPGLPVVDFACCGHGERDQCYVAVKREGKELMVLRGFAARRLMRLLGGRPANFSSWQRPTYDAKKAWDKGLFRRLLQKGDC